MKRLLPLLFIVTVLTLVAWQWQRSRQAAVDASQAHLTASIWVQTLGNGPRFEAQQIFQLQFRDDGQWQAQDSRFTHIDDGISYYDSTFVAGRYELEASDRVTLTFSDGVCPQNGLCEHLQDGIGEFVLVEGGQRENRYRSEPELATTLCLVPLAHWEATQQTMPIFCFDPLPNPITILP